MKCSRGAAPCAAAIAVVLLLGGCSLFAPEKAPAGSTPVAVPQGSEPAVGDAQRQSDVDSCREQARAVLRQEQNITADIRSRDGHGAFRSDSPDLTRNMDAYEARQRYHRIFEDCMRARGYGGGEGDDQPVQPVQ